MPVFPFHSDMLVTTLTQPEKEEVLLKSSKPQELAAKIALAERGAFEEEDEEDEDEDDDYEDDDNEGDDEDDDDDEDDNDRRRRGRK